MFGEAVPGPAAGACSHHPQRPLRRRSAGGRRHIRLGREGGTFSQMSNTDLVVAECCNSLQQTYEMI